MNNEERVLMKGEDISTRLEDLAVRMVKLVLALPKNQVGRHVGGQLLRCGTSAGANYEEARGGQSLADFIHKLAVAWKEIREACFWLKIVQRTQLVKPSRIDELLTEAGELSAILGKSLTTAKNRAKNSS
jgi:four helix bundle protein